MRPSSSLVFVIAPCCGTGAFVIPISKTTATTSSRNVSREWNESRGNRGPPYYQDDVIDQRYHNQPDLSELDYRQSNEYSTMPPQDQEDSLGEEDYYYDDPRPPNGRRGFQQQYSEDLDRGSPIGEFEDMRSNWDPRRYGDGNFGPQRQEYLEETDAYFEDPQNPYGRQDGFRDKGYQRDGYYNDLPRPPPRPQQFQNNEYFNQGQPQGYDSNGYDTFEGSQQHRYDPRSASNRAMVRQNRSNRRQQLQQYGPLQNRRPDYDPPGLGAPGMMGDRMMNPHAGFGMMDRVMGDIANSFEMMDRTLYEMSNSMGRMSSGMEGGAMDQELLEDARAYLQSDSEVTDTLGDNIQFGPPIAQSSSSSSVNGVNRSNIQLVMPVRGNREQGRVKISADEEGIYELAVDVGEDGIIEVLTSEKRGENRRERGSSSIIDVNAVGEVED